MTPDVAAAVYTFAGWLTTRKEALKVGAGEDAAPMADLVGQFCEANQIPDPDMDASEYRHPDE